MLNINYKKDEVSFIHFPCHFFHLLTTKRRSACKRLCSSSFICRCKKATLHVQHTFFVHFFAVVLYDFKVKVMLHGAILNDDF